MINPFLLPMLFKLQKQFHVYFLSTVYGFL